MNTRIFNRLCNFTFDFGFVFISTMCLLGYIVGCLLSYKVSDCFKNIAISILLVRPSFWNLLIVNLVPSTLVAILAFFSLKIFCHPIIFLHSVFYGFIGMSISFIAGSAAWLIRPLLMFSCSFNSLLILLIANWTSHGFQMKNLYRYFLIIVLITIVDYKVISRFLSTLIAYF